MTEGAALVLVLAAVAVVALGVATLYRAIVGPTIQDRVVAINVIGTSTVIVIALVSAALDRPEYLDIAIVYALLNFVLSLAIARFTYRGEEVL